MNIIGLGEYCSTIHLFFIDCPFKGNGMLLRIFERSHGVAVDPVGRASL
jgi:hypothetical protein